MSTLWNNAVFMKGFDYIMVRRLRENNLPDNVRDVFNFVNNSSDRIANKTLAKQIMKKFGWTYDMTRDFLCNTFAVDDLPEENSFKTKSTKKIKEAVDDPEWEAFKVRCQQNPVYRKMRNIVSGSRYKIPEVIYWDGGYLSFAIRPTSEGYMSNINTSNLPTIYYESSRGFRVDVPGCQLYDAKDVSSYYAGIDRAYDVYRLITSLPLEDLEHA